VLNVPTPQDVGMDDESEYVSRLMDEGRLEEYLRSTPGSAESLEVERHQAGHSNETFSVPRWWRSTRTAPF
jgi:hypothetical protein